MKQKQAMAQLSEKFQKHNDLLKERDEKRREALRKQEERERERIKQTQERKHETLQKMVRKWSERLEQKSRSPSLKEASKIFNERSKKAKGMKNLLELIQDQNLENKLKEMNRQSTQNKSISLDSGWKGKETTGIHK